MTYNYLLELKLGLSRQFLDATIEVTKADKEQDVNVFKGVESDRKIVLQESTTSWFVVSLPKMGQMSYLSAHGG